MHSFLRKEVSPNEHALRIKLILQENLIIYINAKNKIITFP